MPLHIAFVVTAFPTVSETFILRQITGLIDRGHDVDIYAETRGEGGTLHEEVMEYDLARRVHYLPRIPKKLLHKVCGTCATWLGQAAIDVGSAVNAVNVLQYGWHRLPSRVYWSRWFDPKREYDVVHCHFASNGVQALCWRRMGLVSGKILTTFHGHDVNCDRGHYNQRDYRALFREGDAFTVNSQFTRRNAETQGCPANKIIQLPVGLSIERYAWAARSVGRGDAIQLLTVGRLVEKKGIEYAIRAFGRLAEEYESLRYTIVGDGNLRTHLEGLIHTLGLDGRVVLLGWKTQRDVQRLMAESHVFVCPSVTCANGDQEAQGLVLQEAQAAGLPIVATDIGGIPESVVPGRSAFLVPEKDSDALAERIECLVEHPEMWPEMGRAGRAYVEAKYDIERLNDRLVQIYRELVEDRCSRTSM